MRATLPQATTSLLPSGSTRLIDIVPTRKSETVEMGSKKMIAASRLQLGNDPRQIAN
jgi:hypothetical protein